MLWACLLLPHLALDGVLRRQSHDGPLVLVDGSANGRVVVAANATARKAGLRVGQRLAAAQALHSQVDAVPYDARAVERWQMFLASVAYRYSSDVCLLPHALTLEVSRSQGLFGTWPAIEQRLRADMADLGFRHRLAAAPTPHAAYVLAGTQDGLAVASPEILRRALDPVPLRYAREWPALTGPDVGLV